MTGGTPHVKWEDIRDKRLPQRPSDEPGDARQDSGHDPLLGGPQSPERKELDLLLSSGRESAPELIAGILAEHGLAGLVQFTTEFMADVWIACNLVGVLAETTECRRTAEGCVEHGFMSLPPDRPCPIALANLWLEHVSFDRDADGVLP